MRNYSIWLHAFRLRTLPLAFSSVILGSLLAFYHHTFRLEIMALALLTTLFLQILSNLANDYGDSKHGVDNINRAGPMRSVQGGHISPRKMLTAIILFAILAFASGCLLVFRALSADRAAVILVFIAIGLAAIGAAIKYTMGKSPYGYKGLGDISVFLFFGLVGVMGTYFMHSQQFSGLLILPAAALGFLSVAVLNINNMRDYENDKASGKNSLIVIMGPSWGRKYHIGLLSAALLCAMIYTIVDFHSLFQLSFLIVLPLFIANGRIVLNTTDPVLLDKELKKVALSALVFSVSFGTGLLY